MVQRRNSRDGLGRLEGAIVVRALRIGDLFCLNADPSETNMFVLLAKAPSHVNELYIRLTLLQTDREKFVGDFTFHNEYPCRLLNGTNRK